MTISCTQEKISTTFPPNVLFPPCRCIHIWLEKRIRSNVFTSSLLNASEIVIICEFFIVNTYLFKQYGHHFRLGVFFRIAQFLTVAKDLLILLYTTIYFLFTFIYALPQYYYIKQILFTFTSQNCVTLIIIVRNGIPRCCPFSMYQCSLVVYPLKTNMHSFIISLFSLLLFLFGYWWISCIIIFSFVCLFVNEWRT